MEKKAYFLEQLEQSFEARSSRNALYSLRAFARDLGISPARLSGVLKGRFGLSKSSATEICEKLGYDEYQKNMFVRSVESLHARSPRERRMAAVEFDKSVQKFSDLSLDQFKIVSDWHHFAIMELTQTHRYRMEDSSQIAKRLKISTIDASGAIKRLLKLELLEENKDGVLSTTGSFVARAAIPNDAIWKHNRQLMEKAQDAIETQSLRERSIASLTVSIDQKHFAEFDAMVRQFQEKIRNKANETKTKNEVYALTVQFFKLT